MGRRLSAGAVLATVTLFAGCGGDDDVTGPPSCEDTGTCPTPPAAPTDLALTVVDQDMDISLTWTDASDDEDGFRIRRRVMPDGAFDIFIEYPANATLGIDVLVSRGESYCYQVAAYNAGGESWSAEACVTTPVASPGRFTPGASL